MQRKTRRLIKITAIIIAVLAIAYTVGGAFYMYHFALEDMSGKDMKQSWQRLADDYPRVKSWADSLKQTGQLCDTTITTNDGRHLHAIYAPAKEKTLNTALIVHGYTCNSVVYLYMGYLFNETLGYNIFLPDLHAHGLSDGDAIQMGWKDADDVMTWIPVCNSIFRDSTDTKMVLHGTSMGGATVMNVSGMKTPDYVRGFIEDSGYTSVWDEFEYELKEQFGLPTFPLLHASSLLTQIRDGWSFGEASPIERLKHSEKPMFFIHSDNDTFVPSWMASPLFEAKKNNKERWTVPGSAHAEAYKDYPEEYAARVKSFLEKIM